jgi:hypothetical protein
MEENACTAQELPFLKALGAEFYRVAHCETGVSPSTPSASSGGVWQPRKTSTVSRLDARKGAARDCGSASRQ